LGAQTTIDRADADPTWQRPSPSQRETHDTCVWSKTISPSAAQYEWRACSVELV